MMQRLTMIFCDEYTTKKYNTHNAVGELVICEVNRKKENLVYRIERTLPHQVRDNCVSKS